MKIVITSHNRKSVTTYSDTCRRFWVYTIIGNSVSERYLVETEIHNNLHLMPVEQNHPFEGMDVLITRELDEELKQDLIRHNNIEVINTSRTLPDSAVADYLAD